MNYYFRMHEGYKGPKYLVYVGKVTLLGPSGPPIRIQYLADKAWAEYDDGTVTVIKDRSDNCGEADLKEFFWVKLSSQRVN